MLFIISSNDPKKAGLTSTGMVSSWETLSWSADKNLDELMKLIDDEEIDEATEVKQNEEVIVSEVETDPKEIDTQTASWDIVVSDEQDTVQQEEKRGFFARLFWKDDEQVDQDSQETMSWSENIEAEVVVSPTTDVKSSPESTKIPVSWNEDFSSDSNIVKTSSNTISAQKVESEIVYPGENIVTSVGKNYEIWVEMLKLNNKTFTKTLAYMNRWDVVTQLSQENSYGCFEVQVQSTGAQWYVCKKYLADTDKEILAQESGATMQVPTTENIDAEDSEKELVKSVPAISTEIGSYYKITVPSPSFFDVILERFTLESGDILKQTSYADPETGCVSMKVVGTSTWERDGEIVSICSPDMVVAIN